MTFVKTVVSVVQTADQMAWKDGHIWLVNYWFLAAVACCLYVLILSRFLARKMRVTMGYLLANYLTTSMLLAVVIPSFVDQRATVRFIGALFGFSVFVKFVGWLLTMLRRLADTQQPLSVPTRYVVAYYIVPQLPIVPTTTPLTKEDISQRVKHVATYTIYLLISLCALYIAPEPLRTNLYYHSAILGLVLVSAMTALVDLVGVIYMYLTKQFVPHFSLDPFGATSLRNFWGVRWNSMFRQSIKAIMVSSQAGRVWVALSIVSIYSFSGVVHEFLVVFATGDVQYVGYMSLYFTLHCIATAVEWALTSANPLSSLRNTRAGTVVNVLYLWAVHLATVPLLVLPFKSLCPYDTTSARPAPIL